MIYPTYGVSDVKTTNEMIRIINTLEKLRINNIPNRIINSFHVDGYNQIVDEIIPDFVTVLSVDDFIKVYEEFNQNLREFITSLIPGTKVFIEERRRGPEAYPFSFTDGMTVYCGKQVTISRVVSRSVSRYTYSNGSDKGFHIEEDDGQYIWHSSMFELEPSVPITKISLTQLNLNLSTILIP